MYQPIYTDGIFSGILRIGDNANIPINKLNKDYNFFLYWLKKEKKTLTKWLSENPYVPTPKTQEEINRDNLKEKFKTKSATIDEIQEYLAGI